MTNERTRRKALVTGASAGIGEGFARHLARDGYDLVLVARRKERLDQLAGQLSAERGVDAEVVVADLTKDEDISPLEERLRAGEFDLLVNNAGFGTVGEFAATSLERQLEEIDLNVRTLVRLTHAALSAMAPRKRGAIINVASAAGFQPIPYETIYAATKAFVLHFSEGVHEEARAHGVTVTCLCPGPVKTEFQEVAGLDDSHMPAVAWVSVDTVVASALSAMRAGRCIVTPGPLNTMGVAGVRMMPRFLVRRIAGSIFRGQAPRA